MQTPCFSTLLPLRLPRRPLRPSARLPLRPRHHPSHSLSHPLTRRATAHASAVPNKRPSSPPPKEGVYLSRAEIAGATRKQRTLRTRRWTTLGELDAADDARDGARRVDVALTVRRVQRDFLVSGATRTQVRRRCDRCGTPFDDRSEGRFEVLLATADADVDANAVAADEAGGLSGEVEAVEPMGTDGVELGRHVRDAVLLGVGTRALCGDQCKGPDLGARAEEKEAELSEELQFSKRALGMDKLLELKMRLEKQGL